MCFNNKIDVFADTHSRHTIISTTTNNCFYKKKKTFCENRVENNRQVANLHEVLDQIRHYAI